MHLDAYTMSRCEDADPPREGADDDDILFAVAFCVTETTLLGS